MQGLDDALKGLSVKDIVNRARNHQKRFTTEQEKVIKDIGGFVVPNAFQIPNEIIDDGWFRALFTMSLTENPFRASSNPCI
jgi:hypothetical protein